MDLMKGYHQFCPVSKASEIFAERWTPLILREMMAGSRHFSDFRKGLPLMSPSLLSKRLKELEAEDIIERRQEGQEVQYHLADAGKALIPVIHLLGKWGHKWTRSKIGENDLDPAFLMWDVKRETLPDRFPDGRTVVSIEFLDGPPKKRRWWLVVEDCEVDLCMKPPPHDVDVAIECGLRTLTEVWMGYRNLKEALNVGELRVGGDQKLVKSFDNWFVLHPLARGGVPRNLQEMVGVEEYLMESAG
jgi:DNA-binding HxlR family transcriptional regulator